MTLTWVISHLILIPVAFRRLSAGLLVALSLIVVAFYIQKNPSYDLISYINSVSASSFIYEPFSNLFLVIVRILSAGDDRLVSVFITVLLALLNIGSLVCLRSSNGGRFQRKDRALLALIVVLSSLYFFLGSQNVVRQCLSVTWFLLYLSLRTKSRNLPAAFCLLLSTLSHFGNIPVIYFMTVYLLIGTKLSIRATTALGAIVATVGLWALTTYFPDVEYLLSDFAYSEERSSINVKWAAIALLVTTTTVVLGGVAEASDLPVKLLLKLRSLLFGAMTAVYVFDLNEMFTRISVNLYAIDMMLLFCLLDSDLIRSWRVKIASLLLLLSPVAAPNVYQILNFQ